MCSTRAWAAVVKSILGYPGADLDTPVSAVWQNNGIEHIKVGGGGHHSICPNLQLASILMKLWNLIEQGLIS
jgi:hypothetical protein